MIRADAHLPHAGGAPTPPAPAPAGGPPPGRLRLGRADCWALLVLVALPVLVMVPFTLIGHPLLQEDNLTQNFPLRVLVGEVLRSGRLPAWDPLIWSGTPLLAGWNAGAMFPATWLFAFLPSLPAWTLDQLVAPVLATTGTYLLLRQLSCRPLASALGAAAFTWAGFMSGQVVHIGLVQGASLLPWSLIGLHSLDRRLAAGAGPRSLAGPVALLGASVGLTVLAGDPRAPSSAVVVLVLYLLACWWRAPRRAPRLLGASAAAGALAVCCSAIQWLPGLGFLKSSQRGSEAYAFYGSGSLSLGHLGTFLLLPFADGGNGNFNQPVYAGSYNLPEITIGMGLLAAAACAAFLPELAAAMLAWRPGRRLVGERPLGVWYALFLVGALLTLGDTTPFGHLFFHLPLFGSERLQNRNAEIFDFALAVLLGFLVEDLVGPGGTERRAAGRAALASRSSRLCALVPLALAVALGVAIAASPVRAQQRFGNAIIDLRLPALLVPYFVWELLVVALVTALVLVGGRLSLSRRRALLVAAAVVDLACFAANAGFATAPSSVASGSSPLSQAVGRLAGADGRFAFYNPLLANPSSNPQALNELGVSDLNIVQDDASVQGYGSIVDATYDAATSTHLYEDLDIDQLAGETFNTLDLSALLTTSLYLDEAIPSHAPIPVAGAPAIDASGHTVTGSSVPAPARDASGPWQLDPGARQEWQLGTPTATVRVDVVVNPQLDGRPSAVRVALSVPGSPLRFHAVPVRQGQARLSFPRHPRATGVVVENPTRGTAVVGAVVAVTADPDQRLLLDGQLQGKLQAPHWRYLGALGPFLAYRNTETRGLAWLQPAGAQAPSTAAVAPGSVRTVYASLARGEQGEQMVVHAPRPSVLVRSATYEPGWTARVTPLAGGATRVVTAQRLGLVQAVALPAGNYRVTWRYAPRQLLVGLVLSALGALLTLGLLLLVWRNRRERPIP